MIDQEAAMGMVMKTRMAHGNQMRSRVWRRYPMSVTASALSKANNPVVKGRVRVNKKPQSTPAAMISRDSVLALVRLSQSPRTRLRKTVAWISTPGMNFSSPRYSASFDFQNVYGVENSSLRSLARRVIKRPPTKTDLSWKKPGGGGLSLRFVEMARQNE